MGTLDRVDDSTLNLLFEVTTPEGDDLLIPASNDLIEEVSAEKEGNQNGNPRRIA